MRLEMEGKMNGLRKSEKIAKNRKNSALACLETPRGGLQNDDAVDV